MGRGCNKLVAGRPIALCHRGAILQFLNSIRLCQVTPFPHWRLALQPVTYA
jgi:hypothetical protein